ncbi:MAG TPA: molybdopterin-dependent oxidoreductase [Chloroflexota bacterium]|nr:molybdopterin-dependent oxidoreductase [Chloroflexota bacterium]
MGFPFPATTNHIRSVISLLTVIIVGSILVGCAGASSLSSPPASPSAAGPTRRPLSATALLIALTPTSTMEVSNSDVVTLTGLVDQPGPITVAALQQFPSQTQTISYQVGRNWQTHTVEGVPLYTVLSRAGITLDPKIKNDQLRKYVVLTAKDGYKVVVALGDLDPNLGNKPMLLAWKQDGQSLSGSQMPLRLAIPNDKLGARQIFGLTTIEVRDVDSPPAAGAAPVGSPMPDIQPTRMVQATTLAVTGQVNQPRDMTVADLQKLPNESVDVSFQGPRGLETHTFQGVRLETILNQTVVALDPNVKYDQLRKYVLATGKDGYETVIDLGAIDPNFGNEPILVAWKQDGKPLSGAAGPFRLVTPGDAHGARYVSGLIRLEVRDVDSPPHTK